MDEILRNKKRPAFASHFVGHDARGGIVDPWVVYLIHAIMRITFAA